MLLPTLIAIPLILIWVLTLIDIVRRDDLRGGSKALWILATLVVPVIGPVVYFVARPGAATAAEREAALRPMDQDALPPSETPTPRHGPA